MPSPHRILGYADLRHHLEEAVFRVRGDGRVGLELEWLTALTVDSRRRPELGELERLASDATAMLPCGGRISIEPGGQLELSTLPRDSARECCEAAADDLYNFERLCSERGIQLVALGADPDRTPERLVTAPRYRAMQRYFDARNQDGLRMMANSASIQLNLGLGSSEHEMLRRWALLNRMGPVLIAAFANSPFADGRITGWKSARMRGWGRIDPTRTAPVPLDGDPREAWLRYALAANVMFVRFGPDAADAIETDMPFGRWMAEGHDLGWPTAEDFAYHLTTLFPPVRPRGWFEVRVMDALPTPFWHVAVSVVCALLEDAAVERAGEVIAGTEDLWAESAHLALDHPALARAARESFELALEVVAGGSDSATTAIVGTYFDRWVARGRTPSDDLIDRFRSTGEILPPSASPIPYAAFETAEP